MPAKARERATGRDPTPGVPASVLDLLHRTISDKECTSNAVVIIKAAATGVSKVAASLCLLLLATGTLVRGEGFPTLGIAVTTGCALVVAGIRHLRRRHPSRT